MNLQFWLNMLLVVFAVGWGLRHGDALWERFWPSEPPRDWQVTITDPDGIPTRQTNLSAKGVARLISDINSGFFK